MSERPTWRLLGFALALLFVLAGMAAHGDGARAQAEPRLSRLGISLWPEFDSPPGGPVFDGPPILVIVQGELAPDTDFPARLSIHIPAVAGEPWAVASAVDPSASPVDRPYETSTEGDSLVVSLETPDPVVLLEFYLPATQDGASREFTYVWPGDLAADAVMLRAQVPLGAEDFQSEPVLGPSEVGTYGLFYRETTLGGLEAGQTLSFGIQYTKDDPRLTVDILSEGESDTDGGGVPLGWPILLGMAAAVVVGVGALVYYRHSYGRPSAARPSGAEAEGAAGFCTQCGKALSAEDRFCSQCGAPVRRA